MSKNLLAENDKQHHKQEFDLISTALEASGWTWSGAAWFLGCKDSRVRRAVVRRHPGIWRRYKQHNKVNKKK